MDHQHAPLRPGFIGTGAIAEAVITGLIEHGGFTGPVVVSRRSAARSAALASRFPNVRIENETQNIVDQCDWVFLAVLPDQARAVLRESVFKTEQTLISLVAGISVDELRGLASPLDRVHRIIPLPPIEYGVGPLPLFPPNPEIATLFRRFGHPVEIDDELQFSSLSAASAVMATCHRLTASVARWITQQGVDPESAAAYASHMLHSLTALQTRADARQLDELAEACLTAGGLNEQVLRELEQQGWFGTLSQRLNRIAERLG